MTDPVDCFDPSLQAVFSELSGKSALNYHQDSRHLFYILLHINAHHDVKPHAHQFLKHHLLEITELYESQFSKHYHPDKISDGLRAQHAISQHDFIGIEDYLRQCSAIILTEPCWLQAVSHTATSQSPIAVKLMSVYLALISDDTYLKLQQTIQSDSPALHTWAFADQPKIADSFFEFAALQLALSCFSRVFFPELLGFTLAYCQNPAQSDYFESAEKKPGNEAWIGFLANRKKRATSQLLKVIEVIRDYLLLFANQADTLWLRIQNGYWLYQEHNQRCYRDQICKPKISAHQAMVELLQNKVASAIGHHSKIQLAGKSLDNWFAEKPFDDKNFLSALRQSPYINKQEPQNSVLLNLFDFKGPMFGVFNQEEKAKVFDWICAETDESVWIRESDKITKTEIKPLKIDVKECVSINFSQLNNRELYYYLVNADLYPNVLTTAKNKVKSILRLSVVGSPLPFKHYSHQAFDEYINSLYQREVKKYQPLEGTPKLSKSAYCWGIEQFAPTILTDGCWLQHINLSGTGTYRDISELLFKIYSDESGNGILAQNHPFIYQQLLDSLDIRLPPIYSKAFIDHPGFISSAFDIPVYLMSISKFPSRFLPELLGLNMAIELSGLGNVYLRLVEELRFWGINPAIVNVHISIDNLGSGHAALAKQTIQLYLDEVLACYGEQEMQRHWQRIYSGYCSLQWSSTRFKYALVMHYLMKRVSGFKPEPIISA